VKGGLVRFPTTFALGAATAFFFDPRLGKGRRHVLRDRSLRAFRRAGRFLTGKTKFFAGHARGAVAETRSAVLERDVAKDDATVKQRIMSEAFRGIPGAASEVNVDVHNGVARLFGRVASESVVDDLVARVREVPGVRAVSPELTIAGAGATVGERTES
jgi:BON domain